MDMLSDHKLPAALFKGLLNAAKIRVAGYFALIDHKLFLMDSFAKPSESNLGVSPAGRSRP
jgi:hypothetical protein